MPQRSLWKLLFISFFAFLVVACKPIASFSVSPDPVQAGVEATFDASASVVYNKPKNNAAKSYAWDFGDGATAAGKVATHTYAAAGTFKVKLTVVDTAGRVGVTTESLVVGTGDVVVEPTTTSLKVITQIAGGVSLSGAEVTVGTASGASDANGLATLDAAPVGEDQVVTVKKAGYITQVVRKTLVADTEDQQMLVLLMPEKDNLSIANIAAAQTINSNYLGASVTLPANAFVVEATGAPAVGAATLKLTPWDISGIDLQAMPGNGRALDASGALVDLISAGMMSVEFFDATGNKLQVAAQMSVDIQMDLPAGTTSIGGNAIAEGTNIPLWYFDETQGLWVGDGNGSVVATATGLAVKASVSHFTSWNWDFVTRPIVDSGGLVVGTPPSPTALTVSCVDADGALVPCIVSAIITYGDGSSRGWNASLAAAVSTIKDMPANTTIEWSAVTSDGLRGTAVSSSSGNVVIQIQAPTTNNFVQCVLDTGAGTTCTVNFSVILTDGSLKALTYYVPLEGATIKTALPIAGDLNWTGQSPVILGADGLWRVYSGAATSTAFENVTLSLSPSSSSGDKSVLVSCAPIATDLSGNDSLTLNSCNISLNIYGRSGEYIASINVPNGLNGPVPVALPGSALGGRVVIFANGEMAMPSPLPIRGETQYVFDELSPGQSIVIQLSARIFDVG